MWTVAFCVFWTAVVSMCLGYYIRERKAKDSKKKPADLILFWIAVLDLAFLTLMAADDLWRERINQYEKGKVVKVVTYKIRKVDGNVEKADSTYTFRLRK